MTALSTSSTRPQLRGPIVSTVLLGGAVRPTSFSSAIQRSFLDLPITPNKSLLHTWCEEISAVSEVIPDFNKNLRIVTDQSDSSIPASSLDLNISVKIDRDPTAWRGTGGVLRDIAASYEPDNYILVANAAQILLAPIEKLLLPLVSQEADVALVGYDDGTPVTFMLIRCGCLGTLSAVGYLDMKEQALPILAKQHRVRVASFDSPMSYGVRTADTYIRALRELSGVEREVVFAEAWKSGFSIAEAGSNVDPSARLHDSVVLRGATVCQGAVLVRSVVCPGSTVAPNAIHVDRLVSATGLESTSEKTK